MVHRLATSRTLTVTSESSWIGTPLPQVTDYIILCGLCGSRQREVPSDQGAPTGRSRDIPLLYLLYHQQPKWVSPHLSRDCDCARDGSFSYERTQKRQDIVKETCTAGRNAPCQQYPLRLGRDHPLRVVREPTMDFRVTLTTISDNFFMTRCVRVPAFLPNLG